MTVTTRSASREASQEADNKQSTPNRKGSKSPRKPLPAQNAGSPERSTRRKLRRATIDAEQKAENGDAAQYTSSESGSTDQDPDKPSPPSEKKSGRGRPKKKRSFDELDADTGDIKRNATGSKQPRKRSRSDDGDDKVEDAVDDSAREPKTDPAEETEAASAAQPNLATQDATIAPAETDDAVNGAEDNEEADDSAILKTTETEVEDTISSTKDKTAEEENGNATAPSGGTAGRSSTPPANSKQATSPTTGIASPQNKRNRDEFTNGQKLGVATTIQRPEESIAPVADSTSFARESTPSMKEPDKKRSRDETALGTGSEDRIPATKVPPGSGFANTSSKSPFGAVSSKPPQDSEAPKAETSSSAFASSGFASFASATQSPFGAFGAAAPPPTKVDDKPVEETKPALVPTFASLSGSKSPFASASTPSAFGSANGFGGSSGFGGLSNGFAGAGGKAPLTSWASGGSSGIIGASSKPAKPFGAPADDEEEEEGEMSEPEDNTIKPIEDGTKDERFYAQDISTGEEGEETIYTTRAKLYIISDDKAWKERAVGTLKINVPVEKKAGKDKAEPQKQTGRFIMRADGSHRIMLNSPITKDVDLRDPTGGRPKGRNALFMGQDGGKLRLMQLKLKSNVSSDELYNAVQALLEGSEAEP